MPFIGRNSPIKRQRAISGAGGDENKLPYACEADPSENYKKHKRRKTKPDKYEYKGNRDSQQHYPTHQLSAIHKQFTSRVARHNVFQAPNIQSQPLSLRMSRHSGIFGNGRFSASFEGRDLPDLTFCQMSFLSNELNHKLSASRNCTEPSSREQQPAKSVQPRVSDYFSKAGCYQSVSPRAHVAASLGPGVKSASPRTLPEKLPRVLPQEFRANSPDTTWNHGVRQQQQQLQQPLLHPEFRPQVHLDAQTAPLLRSARPGTSTTSYASWSASPQREEARNCAPSLPQPLCEQITKVPGGQARLLATNIMPSQCDSLQRKSSCSNARIPDPVRQALLPRYGLDARFQTEKFKLGRKYSLRDLKSLAVAIELENDRQPTDGSGCELLTPVAKTIPYQEVDGISTEAPLEVTYNSGAAERTKVLQNGLLVDCNKTEAELGSASLLSRLQNSSLTFPNLLDNQQRRPGSYFPSISGCSSNDGSRSARRFFDHPADQQSFLPECKCRNSTEHIFEPDETFPVGMLKLREHENFPSGQPCRLSDSSDSAPSVARFENMLDPLNFDEFDANLVLDGSWRYGRGADSINGNITWKNNASVATSSTEVSTRGRFGICVQPSNTFGGGEHGPKISGNDYREGEKNDSIRKGPVLLRPSLESWSDMELFAPFTKPYRLS